MHTHVGLRKPDLVAKKADTALVIDAYVMGEQSDLTRAHERKCVYYRESIQGIIKTRYDVKEIEEIWSKSRRSGANHKLKIYSV